MPCPHSVDMTSLSPELQALVSEHPLRNPHAQLMTALYLSGRHADALAVYRDFRPARRGWARTVGRAAGSGAADLAAERSAPAQAPSPPHCADPGTDLGLDARRAAADRPAHRPDWLEVLFARGLTGTTRCSGWGRRGPVGIGKTTGQGLCPPCLKPAPPLSSPDATTFSISRVRSLRCLASQLTA